MRFAPSNLRSSHADSLCSIVHLTWVKPIQGSSLAISRSLHGKQKAAGSYKSRRLFFCNSCSVEPRFSLFELARSNVLELVRHVVIRIILVLDDLENRDGLVQDIAVLIKFDVALQS